MKPALRALAKSPSFTLVSICLLALGIGANTAVFTVTHRVLLERLPVPHPQELVQLGDTDSTTGKFSDEFSYRAFHIFSSQDRLFSGLFGFSDPMEANVVSGGVSGLAHAVVETTNYSRVLGIEAYRGRLLNDADASPTGETPAAVLSFDYWQKRFGEDPRVIGAGITVNGVPFVVVGVMPRGFRGLTLGVREDVVLPIHAVDAVRRIPTLHNDGNWWLHIAGRRAPGVSLPEIRAALAPAFASAIETLVAAWPPALAGSMRKFTADLQFSVRPTALGTDSTARQQLEMPLTILMTITAVIFVIAGANLAGLMLARAASRSRETGIRLALGCGRARLVRAMLLENLLLSIAGGLAGVVAAWWMGPALVALLGGAAVRETVNGHPNATALLVGIGLALVAGVAPGMIPALRAARLDPQYSIRKGTTPAASPKSPLGRGLIVLQMATSLALLTGAGQFLQTLRNYRNLDPGYRPDNLVLVGVNPGSLRYTDSQKIAYTRRIREALAAIPGVRSATFSSSAMGTMTWITAVRIPGFQPTGPMSDATGRNMVGPGFVETLGMTLLSGRDFEPRDTRDAAPAVIVNQAFARHFFGPSVSNAEVIGRPVFFIDSLKRAHTIIGVVKDARDRGVKTAPGPAAYTSYEHDPLGNITFAVRTGRDPLTALKDISAVLRSVDPLVPISSSRSMRMQMDESLQRERMMAALSAMFGVVAILVAAVGLYGLLAWATAGRTREIGVRIALGARPLQVEWLALKDSLAITGLGAALGIPLYLAFARVIRGQVFGVSPSSPRILLATLAILLLAAAAATVVPAWRAGRVDPNEALRHE